MSGYSVSYGLNLNTQQLVKEP